MSNVMRFTSEGLVRFEEEFAIVKSGGTADFRTLASNPTHSVPIEVETQILDLPNTSRYEIAQFLSKLLSEQVDRVGYYEVSQDAGLWTWLACYYFDDLLGGAKSVGNLHKWRLFPSEHTRRYKHLLFGPFSVIYPNRDNPSRTHVLLSNESPVLGEIYEQVASRQEFIASKVVLDAISILYFDNSLQKPKSGATRQTKGGIRRFVEVYNQYCLTWNLANSSPERVISLLPEEFKEFKAS
jgi:hypothetical protein